MNLSLFPKSEDDPGNEVGTHWGFAKKTAKSLTGGEGRNGERTEGGRAESVGGRGQTFSLPHGLALTFFQ